MFCSHDSRCEDGGLLSSFLFFFSFFFWGGAGEKGIKKNNVYAVIMIQGGVGRVESVASGKGDYTRQHVLKKVIWERGSRGTVPYNSVLYYYHYYQMKVTPTSSPLPCASSLPPPSEAWPGSWHQCSHG